MDRQQLEKTIDVELELYKVYGGFASGLAGGTVALFLIKAADRPEWFNLFAILGVVFAFGFAALAVDSLGRLRRLQRRYNSLKKDS